MEIKKKDPNIELRSEEVQELMGKIPPAILRVGISVVLVFVVLIVIASNYIKYPETLSIPVVAKNINYMEEIKATTSGKLIESHMKHSPICVGDTLVQIAVNHGTTIDTVIIRSPMTGIVFPCLPVQENDYVNGNEVLCVVADSVKDRIVAKASLSDDLKEKITPGMSVETNIDNNMLQGKIVTMANYANPMDNTYAITILFENPEELKNTIIWNRHTKAKVRVATRSVFEKFFKEKFLSTVKQ